MRYVLYGFVGEPTTTMPVGMNDILGLGRYTSVKDAWHFLVERQGARSRAKALGYTHLALYSWPENFQPDNERLVRTEKLT